MGDRRMVLEKRDIGAGPSRAIETLCVVCAYPWADHGVGGNCTRPPVELQERVYVSGHGWVLREHAVREGLA